MCPCTLNRKTLTSSVRTKPRGSVVITKPRALQMSLCACKASWLYTWLYIIKSCSMNHFVLPRGQWTPIIPFAKTNGTQLAVSVWEFTLLLSTIFLCKYTKVMWLCTSKGFHNSFLRVCEWTFHITSLHLMTSEVNIFVLLGSPCL